MKARQTNKAKRIFKDEHRGRRLIKQLKENDRMDGQSIQTSEGQINKH